MHICDSSTSLCIGSIGTRIKRRKQASKKLKDMVKNAHILQYYDRANLFLLVLTLAQKVWSSIYPNSETRYLRIQSTNANQVQVLRSVVRWLEVAMEPRTPSCNQLPCWESTANMHNCVNPEVLRGNIQLRATVMKTMQTTPLNRQMYLFRCNPHPRAQAGSSDHRQN